MGEETIIAYGRVVDGSEAYLLAMFGTTNPWIYMMKTGLPKEVVEQMEKNSDLDIRKFVCKSQIRTIDDPIIFAAEHPATETDFTEYDRVGHVGEFENEADCKYFLVKGINAIFLGKRDRKTNIKELAIPLSRAIMSLDRERTFHLQSELLERYEGPPLERYARKLCSALRNRRNELAGQYFKLIEAIEREDYESAAVIDGIIRHNPLDNRAQGI